MSDTPSPIDTAQQSAVDYIQQLIDAGDIDGLNAYLAENLATLSPETQTAVLEQISSAGLSEAVGPGLAGEDQQPGPVGPSIIDQIPDDPVAAGDWYERNYANLSAEEKARVVSYFGQQATSADNGPAWAELTATASQGAPTLPAEGAVAAISGEALADAEQAAIDWYAEHLTPAFVASGQDIPELPGTMRPAGMSDQEYATWQADQIAAGEAQARQTAAAAVRADNPGMTDEEINQQVSSVYDNLGINQGIPSWILEQFGGLRGFGPSVQQRLVDYWNDQYNTNFANFAELAPHLDKTGPTVENKLIVQAAADDQEPLLTHGITIRFTNGAQRVNFTEDEMAAMREMGFSNDAITRLVRLAGLNMGSEGVIAGRLNATSVAALAGLSNYYGAAPEFAGRTAQEQALAQQERRMGLSPGEFSRMTYSQRHALRHQWQARYDERGDNSLRNRLAAFDRAEGLLPGQRTREEESNRSIGSLAANRRLESGMASYNGDEVLAFVHAIDPALAQRVAASGNDPTRLSWQDNARALDILDRSGVTNRGTTPYERLGGRIRRSLLSQLSYFDTTDQGGGRGGGGGGGGGGGQRRMIDPVSVKQQLIAKFSDLMLPDIPDAVVKSVQDMLQAQLDKSDPGMSFDVSARILDWVQGRPEYRELYGHKPEGMTEAEYQTQFQAGVQDMLGAQTDTTAVKAGLRSNDYQAAIGVANIGGLYKKNSRLMGRWALAKQTLDKFS
jgi:hypothetical protein